MSKDALHRFAQSGTDGRNYPWISLQFRPLHAFALRQRMLCTHYEGEGFLSQTHPFEMADIAVVGEAPDNEIDSSSP